MAACPINAVYEEVCDSQFDAVAQDNPVVIRRGIELQLLYQSGSNSGGFATIYAQACANGFDKVAQNSIVRRAVRLQIICDRIGGV